MIEFWKRWFQLDRSLAYALFARLWQVASGPITIILIVRCFSAGDQGIYTTMIALASLQNFFELGYLNLLISRTGRIFGRLQVANSGTATSDNLNQGDRLKLFRELVLLRCEAKRWLLLISSVFAAIAIIVGWFVLGRTEIPMQQWLTPMLAHILITAAVFYLSHEVAILEGLGGRNTVYQMQLAQMLCGTVAVWLAIITGLKLWTLPISAFVQWVWMISVLCSCNNPEFVAVRNAKPLTELSPASLSVGQRKMAIYSFAFFLATQPLTLIAAAFLGEVDAGRLGLTLTATQAIQLIASAWLQTKFAVASKLHAEGNRSAAGRMWRRAVAVSSLMLIALLFSVWGLLIAIAHFLPNYSTRFITANEFAIYSAGCLANHLLTAQTLYVLARRSEPLTIPAVLGFCVVTIATIIGCWLAGNSGLTLGFSAAYLLVCLPVHSWAYWKFRQTPTKIATT